MISISREQFERLVHKALSNIPPDIRLSIQNVDIVVDNVASMNQIAGTGIENEMELLGLYEGIPITERYGYDMVLPDKITLFQKPIEAICDNQEQITEEISKTLIHEIAHHFGLDDNHLDQLERY
ncbi:MAG: metallopeptidase family protein [SAR202 cluster bacterium]|nr:metallopeptidase family protein [SAR202 cluster bacterium]MQF68041.1 metallopeptidase family protein [SAR202 cluster bacterium AD-802-K11_MRT_200m]